MRIIPRQTEALANKIAEKNTKIATSYTNILTNWLKSENIEAEPVYFSGAVEIAPKLGRADFICDLVSTGSTLAANGLVEVATLLESEAVVIQTRAALGEAKQALVDRMLQRREIGPAVGEQLQHVAAEEFQRHRSSSSTLKAAWSEMRDQGRPWCTSAWRTEKPRA